MPRKEYRKKRKKFFGKNKNNKTVSLILPGLHVVPDEMIVRLRYNVSATHGGTGIITTQLAGNNPNAVFVGGTGQNAAMGMFEWGNFYNRYQVLGSTCDIDFLVDTDPTLKHGIKVSLVPFSSTANPPTSVAQAGEMTFGKSMLLAENQNKTQKMSSYMSTRKILGYHNSIDDVENTHANTKSAAPPVQVWNWGILSDSLASGAYELQFDGYVDYYIRLFQRRTLQPNITPP